MLDSMAFPLQGQRFYINYEECKCILQGVICAFGASFILTMRNVNNINETKWCKNNLVLY